ncbi:MAG: tRNA (N6-isopentenyl adenosine(37)-C2)-methylthiotransferase MiaB [Oscillospiraceae bacterium]
MSIKRTEISAEAVAAQLQICAALRAEMGDAPRFAKVETFGCQQNEEDSEKLRGYLAKMGYAPTEDEYLADIIIINTCAVREHAEQRVFGNLGTLTHTKAKNPKQIIAVCGCMAREPHVTEKIKKSYSLVDLVFAPDEIWRFPQLLSQAMTAGKPIFAPGEGDGCIAEGVPHSRTEGARAWLSIMYGCNNFCSYCIVPYTRLRERSRRWEDILSEARELIASGYKEITLLGQNVNSYGNDLENGISFAELIRRVNALEGDFILRFMTSHPKDANEELFAAMRDCEKCEKHLHLPLQSGSNRILQAMNRRYTAEKYLALVEKAREYMPEIVLTTDIIVGFPDETDEDFDATIDLVKKVSYDAMFTFIYSKRQGTPAASLPDPFTREEKQRHFDRLIEVQNAISEARHKSYIGKRLRVLIDGEDREQGFLTARTNGGRLLRLSGEKSLIGSFAEVLVVDCNTWSLRGEIIK